MNSLTRLSGMIRSMPIRVLFCLPLAVASAQAADLSIGDQTVIEARPPIARGQGVPACTETRPDHLIACVPRNFVAIEPDEPIANAVYALKPPRQRRPYVQVFTWGP